MGNTLYKILFYICGIIKQIDMKTKQKIFDQIEELQCELKQLKSQKFDPNKFIDSIFNNFVRKADREKYPDVAFFGFDLEGNFLFEYNEKTGVFWVSYVRIWSVLETEMKGKYTDVQKFIKTKVEEHFKLRDVAPFIMKRYHPVLVEEHFKLRDNPSAT